MAFVDVCLLLAAVAGGREEALHDLLGSVFLFGCTVLLGIVMVCIALAEEHH